MSEGELAIAAARGFLLAYAFIMLGRWAWASFMNYRYAPMKSFWKALKAATLITAWLICLTFLFATPGGRIVADAIIP